MSQSPPLNVQKSSCVRVNSRHTQVSKLRSVGQLFSGKLTARVRRAQEGSHEDICEVTESTEPGLCSLSGRPYRGIPGLAKLLGLQVLCFTRETLWGLQRDPSSRQARKAKWAQLVCILS